MNSLREASLIRSILQCVLVLVLFVATNSAAGCTIAHEPRLAGELDSIGAVAGRVVDLGGNPIANARVRVRGAKANEREREVVSNARGEYELTALPAGECTLEVVADGYQPTVRAGVVVRAEAVTRDVNLTLSTRLTISGVVVGERDGPIADARVTGYPRGAGRSVLARTDSLGRFTVSLEVAAPHRLAVEADGYEREPGAPRGDGSTARTDGGEAPSGELGPYFLPGTTDVRVMLKRPRVTFVVIDALSSQPLTDFTLQLDERFIAGAQQSFGIAHYRSQLHSGGELECEADSRRHSYLVTAPGYRPVRGDIVFDPPGSRRCVVRMVAGGGVSGVALLDGKPVVGARVVLREWTLAELLDRRTFDENDAYWDDWEGVFEPYALVEGSLETRSDANGAFGFDSLDRGEWRLEIVTQTGERRSLEPVHVREDRRTNLEDLELLRAASVVGRVLTPEGTSPAGLHISMWVFDVSRRATTDAEGRFVIPHAPAGRAHLEVSTRTLSAVRRPVPMRHLELAPGQTHEIELDLREGGAASVRVTARVAGRSMSDLRVTLRPSNGSRPEQRLGWTSLKGVVENWTTLVGEIDVCMTTRSGMPAATFPRAAVLALSEKKKLEFDLVCGGLVFEWPNSPPGTRSERVELRGRRLDRDGLLEPVFFSPAAPVRDEAIAHASNRREFPMVEPGDYEWTIRVLCEATPGVEAERIYRKQTSVRAGALAECVVGAQERVRDSDRR